MPSEVIVTDQYGKPVTNAEVTVKWRGAFGEVVEEGRRTGPLGVAVVRTPPPGVRFPFGATGVVEVRKGINRGEDKLKTDVYGEVQDVEITIHRDATSNLEDVTDKVGSVVREAAIYIAVVAVALALLIYGVKRR
jgi:hypothetical protein